MSGETNRLLALAKELSAIPSPRELDVVAATGEQVTIGLLAIALQEMGLKARSYTGGQVRVLTDSASPRRASSRSTRRRCATTSRRARS
jgi:aspartate kinase